MLSRRLLPLFLLGFLGGCSRATAPPQGAAPISARFPADDLGRPIALQRPARRVVAIGPGLVETIFALGAQKQLVGRDEYATFPAPATAITVAGNFQGPTVEPCLALRPDLVIVQGETSNRARFDEWQSKLGVPTAALTTTSFRGLASDIRALGQWLDKPAPANALAQKFEFPAPKPTKGRALIQTGDEAGWIAGRGTLVSDAAAHAGWGNIADQLGIQGYAQVNVEELLVHPPDAIIVPSKKTQAQVLASLRLQPGLAKLPCVQRGRVVVVDGDLLLRPGPRLLQGVEQLKTAK